MANQAADFALIVGKTVLRPYIDEVNHNILLNFNDETWFNVAAAQDLDLPLFFTHIIGHQFLFDALIISVDVIDVLDVSVTTSKGTTVFNTVLANPGYTNGQLDIYPVTDVSSFDDNRAVRLIFISETIQTNPNNYLETVYELLSYDK